MTTSSVPATRAALVRATCDGSGLITLPTSEGPEHFACLGCRSCATRPAPPVALDPFSRIPEAPSDEVF